MSVCLRRPEGGSLPTTRLLHTQVLEGRIGGGGAGPGEECGGRILSSSTCGYAASMIQIYLTVIASVEQNNLFYFRNNIFFINILYIFVTHAHICQCVYGIQKIVMYDWLPRWLEIKDETTFFEIPKYIRDPDEGINFFYQLQFTFEI